MKTFLSRLLVLLGVFTTSSGSVMGLISDNITDLPLNATLTDYVFAYNNMFGQYPMFSFLLSIMVVVALAVFSWSENFIDGLIMGSLISTFVGFLMSIITDSFGNPLISFERLVIFIVILALTALYKQVVDRN